MPQTVGTRAYTRARPISVGEATAQVARARALAETAGRVRLTYLRGHLLAWGRLSPEEFFVSELVVVTAPIESCRLGPTFCPWSWTKEAISRSLCGWSLARVTEDKRVVAPAPGDYAVARARLVALGIDPTRPLYEVPPGG